MGNLAEYKLYLIQLISAIDNRDDLKWLEQQLEQLRAKKKTRKSSQAQKQPESTYEALKNKALEKPYREKLDVEAIKKEQGWTGQHDREGILQLIREIDVQEPVEELLDMLTP